jgi:hypothetical protein
MKNGQKSNKGTGGYCNLHDIFTIWTIMVIQPRTIRWHGIHCTCLTQKITLSTKSW